MDRNTLVAFFLIALVLIFTPKYMEMVSPVPQNQAPDSSFFSQRNELDLVDQKVKKPAPPIKTITPDLATPNLSEETFTIENELYIAEVSSVGGGTIKSFSIKEYFNGDSAFVNLVNKNNELNLLLSGVDLDGQQINMSKPWTVSSGFFGGKINKQEVLSFSLNLGPGAEITRTLVFDPSTYVIEIQLRGQGLRDFIFGDLSLGWFGGLPPTEENVEDDRSYFNSYVYQGGELEDLKTKQGDSDQKQFNGSTDWTAVRTKYFIVAMVPETPDKIRSATLSSSYVEDENYNMVFSVDPSQDQSFSLYLGPLEYEKIKAFGHELDLVMDFGWAFVRPISKAVLFSLKKMHEYIPNYGFVLILFSIFVKILVFPLTKKSYQSTSAMQLIQPEVAAIKEKHASNPQKVNQLTMQLYKEKGVNPLGGCLPMMLQMPLLFALFIVFRTTIELRMEPFVWWIKDLSSPDIIFNLPFKVPIYGAHVAVLPMLMVVSMFIQQRMMSGGAAQQPQQKTMQYFMTGFFFLMFNTFPSGLNLYYTLFNVLTILQQKLIPSNPSAVK
mgnify:FL=1|jgi:YidC/Oxa1 family membrane protein insertase